MRAAEPSRARPLTPILVAALVATLLGCVAGRPDGALFERLAPPDASSTLVYIYRLDAQRGIYAARVRMNGDDLTHMRNGEYVAVVVDPGIHTVRGALMWMGLFARSWNDIRLEARGGQTLYVKLSAATDEIPAPAVDVPGQPDRRADVGLFMSLVDRATAERDLPALRRAKTS